MHACGYYNNKFSCFSLCDQIRNSTVGSSVWKANPMITNTWCQRRSYLAQVQYTLHAFVVYILSAMPPYQFQYRVFWFVCFLILLHLLAVSVLTELVASMHSLRDKYNIKSHCPCNSKPNLLTKLPATNGVSQVLFQFLGSDTFIPVWNFGSGVVDRRPQQILFLFHKLLKYGRTKYDKGQGYSSSAFYSTLARSCSSTIRSDPK